MLAPSQWDTSLQSNAVSHWLGVNLESSRVRLAEVVLSKPFDNNYQHATQTQTYFAPVKLLGVNKSFQKCYNDYVGLKHNLHYVCVYQVRNSLIVHRTFIIINAKQVRLQTHYPIFQQYMLTSVLPCCPWNLKIQHLNSNQTYQHINMGSFGNTSLLFNHFSNSSCLAPSPQKTENEEYICWNCGGNGRALQKS